MPDEDGGVEGDGATAVCPLPPSVCFSGNAVMFFENPRCSAGLCISDARVIDCPGGSCVDGACVLNRTLL
jgi:hypothetical protein